MWIARILAEPDTPTSNVSERYPAGNLNILSEQTLAWNTRDLLTHNLNVIHSKADVSFKVRVIQSPLTTLHPFIVPSLLTLLPDTK